MSVRSARTRPIPDQPLRYKTSFMQRTLDLVARGYVQWVGGTVKVGRLTRLRAKFAANYGTAADEAERRRMSRHGVPRAWLVIHAPRGADRAHWLLLAQSEHPATFLEHTADARSRDGRIQIPVQVTEWADYELVRIDGTWTWRMTKERRQAWRDRIHAAVRQPDPEQRRRDIRQVAWSLARVPGFRGIRADAKALVRLTREDWRRVHSGPMPAKLRNPGWVRRILHQ
ncbi:hypothetical protein ACNSTU_07290 [Aquisalimonas sp. APHAB1-3]|uniref:hypothetical protein n=1 Tax=Aquisalimonas sp. APHAB1-3 TaxID=3402080 RepID=UPI003AAE283C